MRFVLIVFLGLMGFSGSAQAVASIDDACDQSSSFSWGVTSSRFSGTRMLDVALGFCRLYTNFFLNTSGKLIPTQYVAYCTDPDNSGEVVIGSRRAPAFSLSGDVLSWTYTPASLSRDYVCTYKHAPSPRFETSIYCIEADGDPVNGGCSTSWGYLDRYEEIAADLRSGGSGGSGSGSVSGSPETQAVWDVVKNYSLSTRPAITFERVTSSARGTLTSDQIRSSILGASSSLNACSASYNLCVQLLLEGMRAGSLVARPVPAARADEVCAGIQKLSLCQS